MWLKKFVRKLEGLWFQPTIPQLGSSRNFEIFPLVEARATLKEKALKELSSS
jgi:hypothetical protein